MSNFFEFFAQIGDYIVYIMIIAVAIALYLLGKKIYTALNKNHSENMAKIVSIAVCVLIGSISIFSLICSQLYHSKYSDGITVIYYDSEVEANETMHIIFKGNPNTDYEIEFESAGESCKKKSDSAGYVTYTCIIDKSYKGEESDFYIYDIDSKGDISTEHYSFQIR